MTTISVRINEELKRKFHKVAQDRGVDSSSLLRLFIKKVTEEPSMVKVGLDPDLLSDVMQIGEHSFSEVWDNSEDDVYAKLYAHV
ncbi:MAG: type II toxin-antitoxin system RelB/DinJ family antitoxin [Candidatus Peribacteria bacterium]|nr:MAG: type II toxin-antitoxin system RelB/DinJ family antitoxin [Candidatus Peribacteria bacterium]